MPDNPNDSHHEKAKEMKEITFLVQGSAADPYRVQFRKDDTNLSAWCTCQAGEMGQYCKHRLRILAGETTGIVSDNMASVSEVKSWVAGSDVERAMQELKWAETQLDTAKDLVSACKKKLARTLIN